MNSNLTQRRYFFHPITVLTVAAVATAVFAFLVYSIFDGDRRLYVLYYSTPIGIPFVCFIFDRVERYKTIPKGLWVVDLAVLITALTRALLPIPLISGHAIFLSYALLTSHSKVTRITAALIMLQVAYLKIFIWHDVTILGGVILGSLAASAYRRLRLTSKDIRVTT